MAMSDGELLRRYAAGGQDAEEAFGQLVRLHAGWVYAVARRRVGDRELAEDVAQAAFIVLAQKGKRLAPQTPLAPWLFRVTCFAASRALRDESRRRRHEADAAMTIDAHQRDDDAMAWEQLAPMLDEAVESLRTADRHAVLLRFYQRRSLAEVGESLGISEDAARKRVARAIERLRHRLTALGVRSARVAPTTGLAAVLLERAADASADVAMLAQRWAGVSVTADSAAASASASASATSNELAKGAIEMILWNNTKAAVLAVLAMAVVIGGASALVHAVVAQRSAQSRTVAVNAAAAAPEPPPVTTIESENLLLAVSPDGLHLAGFSMATGKWQPMPQAPRTAGNAAATAPAAAPAEIDRNRIVVASNVGVYRDAQRVYGFSGITGKWDSAPASAPVDAGSGLMVAQNVAACADGNRVHAFSALTGTWDTLTLPTEAGPTKPQPVVTQMTVRLQHEKSFYLFSAKTGKWTEPPFQSRE